VVHASQRLKRSCGSIPFCAPEVFSRSSTAGPGYNGIAADIWSLGVSWIELMGKPYSVEGMLGWYPRHPGSQDEIYAGLQSLPARWSQVKPHSGVAELAKLITEMVVLEPEERLAISQVVGPDGLCLKKQAPSPVPCSSARSVIGAPCKKRKEAHRRPTGDLSFTLRAGGFAAVSAAFSKTFEDFLGLAGFGRALSARPEEEIERLRGFYTQEMPSLFDVAPQSPEQDALCARIRDLHAGLPLSKSHVKVMAQSLANALLDLGVPSRSAAEAAKRFKHLHPDICSSWAPSVAAAVARNQPEWRSQQLRNLQPSAIMVFARGLMSSVESNAMLKETALNSLAASEIETHFVEYLRNECGEEAGPVPLPLDCNSQQAHLVFVEEMGEALLAAEVPSELVETLYWTSLDQWASRRRNTPCSSVAAG